MRERGKGHSAHLGVLLFAVAIALAICWGWLEFGARWTHDRLTSQVVATPSALAPASAASALAASASVADRAQIFSELGQTGDTFGSVNALLTAVAGAIVFWAGFLQKEQLNQTRRDAASARQDAADERKSRQKQEFESLFFRLLDLSRDITSKIETPRLQVKATFTNPANEPTALESIPGRTGGAALDHFAWRIDDGWTQPMDRNALLTRLVDRFRRRAYNRAPSAFGPYFRILYQTFKHVAESNAVADTERIRYANLARGQISEGAILLLALNGLTLDGYKFVPLIEKFGLLEHLHRSYAAKYGDALRIGYRPRAFMGSTERGKPENAFQPVPLLAANHFGGLGPMEPEDDDD